MPSYHSLQAILPELFLLTALTLMVIVSVFPKRAIPDGQFNDPKQSAFMYVLALLAVIGTFILVIPRLYFPTWIGFNGLFVSDGLSTIFKLMMVGVTFPVLVYSRKYIQQRDLPAPEFYMLLLFSLLGMMVLVSAESYLTIYLGLELLTLPVYALVALQRKSGRASEAAIKYFVMGAIASGFILYGISILFGLTSSIMIPGVANVTKMALSSTHAVLYVLALIFFVGGIAFKLGAVPFHLWVPDVYEGAPAPVAMFIASVPKIAGLALALRILVFGMLPLQGHWITFLTLLTVLSIGLGNLTAIVQTNFKRLLAYSAISHAGFMLLGFVAGTKAGFTAATFYMFAYAIMTVAAFGLITMLSHKGVEAERIEDFKGLNQRSPWLAFLMLVVMFSLAGVPPTLGFFAKFSVLTALLKSGHVPLAVFSMIFAVIGAYYYLRVIRVMYFDDPVETSVTGHIVMDMKSRCLISINVLMILFFGIFPNSLLHVATRIFT